VTITYAQFLEAYEEAATKIYSRFLTLNRQERRGRTKNGRARSTSKRIKKIIAEKSVLGFEGQISFDNLGITYSDIIDIARLGPIVIKNDRYRQPEGAYPRNRDEGRIALGNARKNATA
jgi:hypothetical protein